MLPAVDSAEARAAVAFGSPPGIAWAPLPVAPFEHVRQGFVVAPADIALAGRHAETAEAPGTVVSILVAAKAEGDMQRVSEAGTEAGHGLVGDRYHAGVGTFSNPHARGHDLTLIEQDVIDDLRGVFPGYRAEDTRRNIVASGIAPERVGRVALRYRRGRMRGAAAVRAMRPPRPDRRQRRAPATGPPRRPTGRHRHLRTDCHW